MPLLIFNYSMMGQLVCKYEPFWQEVCIESQIKAYGPLVDPLCKVAKLNGQSFRSLCPVVLVESLHLGQ